MWESSLYSKLINDAKLIAYVSTIGDTDVPSIFSSSAPENTPFPYIVFTIDEVSSPSDSVIKVYDVQIAVFDFNQSGKRARLAIRRLGELLDKTEMEHEYYKNIRINSEHSFQAGRDSEDEDPRAQHFIARFNARACRKGWIDNLTS